MLLCKTHANSDITVELINYDEEELRNAVPIQTVSARIASITALTSDIVSLKLQTGGRFTHRAGQYAEIRRPGSDVRRSFSMATTPGSPEVEFIIKKYPGGHFSGLLDSELKPGDPLTLTGPYGSCTLRASGEDDGRRVVCIAGGAGMAPILSLLRRLAETGSRRPVVFYYGARTPEDLFYLPEILALGERIRDFRFVPALSHVTEAPGGRSGSPGISVSSPMWWTGTNPI